MTTTEAAKESIQTLPPVTVAVVSYNGITLQEWVYIATIAYTVIQLLRLIPKIIACMRCFYKNGNCNRNCKLV